MNWPRAHWTVGTVTLALFPLAGAYMRYVAHVPVLPDAPRMIFRSRFLFLLLIALANLALSGARPKLMLERIASAAVLVAPVPLVVSFLVDANRGYHSSPWTVWTMRGLFAAGVFFAFARRPR